VKISLRDLLEITDIILAVIDEDNPHTRRVRVAKAIKAWLELMEVIRNA